MYRKFEITNRRRVAALVALGLGTALYSIGPEVAFGADAQPRDFLPAPAGTQLALLYGIVDSSSSFYDTNRAKVPSSGLDDYVGIARYVYFYDIAGMRADINVVQPFGELNNMHIGGMDLATRDVSVGDTSIVSTFWLLNDPVHNRYFAVATYLTLPTGQYSSDKAGLGSNRWSAAVQPAFYFDIAPKWSVDLVGDITIYGDNNDGPGGVTIKKDPNFTGLAWLNYKVADASTLSIGVSATTGGKETWGVVDRGDSSVVTTRAAWLQMLNPTTQFVMQLSTDVYAENNFRRGVGGLVRLAKFF